MAANRFFVSNTEEFLEGFVALLQQCGLFCQENSDGELPEFHGRRLEEYQRTFAGDAWPSKGVCCFSRDSAHSRMFLLTLSNSSSDSDEKLC